MSTGMLRIGSSRQSKTKSPYARPPAPSATPPAPRMQRTRGSTHTDSAASGNDLLPVCTSGRRESRPLNFSLDVQSHQPSGTPVVPNLPDAQPQLQDVFSPMSTPTQNVAYQPGMHVNPLVSITSNLGANIPLSTQEKIWNNEYIDLAKLLYLDPAADIQQLLVFEDGEIKLKNKSKDRKITSISEWTDSILIYAAIYLHKFPHQTQGLLKYISSIRLGASRSTTFGWRDYDIQFRLRRSKNSMINWENIDAELWLIYMGPAPVTERKPTYNLHQHKRCYDYNLKGSCQKKDCRFSHTCLKCNKNHPSINCFSNQTSHNTSKGPTHNPGSQNFNSNVTQSRFQKPFRQ